METLIQISKNRIAKITASLSFNHFLIKEITLTNEKDYDKTFINEDKKLTFVEAEISILSESYKPEATKLTNEDFKLIQEAVFALTKAVRKQPFSLTEYYS